MLVNVTDYLFHFIFTSHNFLYNHSLQAQVPICGCTNFCVEYPTLRNPRIRSQMEFLSRNLCFDLQCANLKSFRPETFFFLRAL